LKSIEYFYAPENGHVDHVLLVIDNLRIRLNEQEIDELDKRIKEIKQLFSKENKEQTILNQETVLKG